jgi:hypothetical protein
LAACHSNGKHRHRLMVMVMVLRVWGRVLMVVLVRVTVAAPSAVVTSLFMREKYFQTIGYHFRWAMQQVL